MLVRSFVRSFVRSSSSSRLSSFQLRKTILVESSVSALSFVRTIVVLLLLLMFFSSTTKRSKRIHFLALSYTFPMKDNFCRKEKLWSHLQRNNQRAFITRLLNCFEDLCHLLILIVIVIQVKFGRSLSNDSQVRKSLKNLTTVLTTFQPKQDSFDLRNQLFWFCWTKKSFQRNIPFLESHATSIKVRFFSSISKKKYICL